jgi:hypothetical protein
MATKKVGITFTLDFEAGTAEIACTADDQMVNGLPTKEANRVINFICEFIATHIVEPEVQRRFCALMQTSPMEKIREGTPNVM